MTLPGICPDWRLQRLGVAELQVSGHRPGKLEYKHDAWPKSLWIGTMDIYQMDVCYTLRHFYVLQPMGRGTYWFCCSSRWCWLGVGVSMTLSCLHNILWTGGWILTKFSWIYYWDVRNICLDFGDHDLIFKVTAVEKPKIHGWGTSVFSENTVTSSPLKMMFEHIFFFFLFLLPHLRSAKGLGWAFMTMLSIIHPSTHLNTLFSETYEVSFGDNMHEMVKGYYLHKSLPPLPNLLREW